MAGVAGDDHTSAAAFRTQYGRRESGNQLLTYGHITVRIGIASLREGSEEHLAGCVALGLDPGRARARSKGETEAVQTCTTSTVQPVNLASRIAHRSAATLAGDPSSPTTIRAASVPHPFIAAS